MNLITTARTYIREFTLNDADAVLKFNRNRHVTKYTGDAGMVNHLADAQSIIENIWLHEYETYGYGRWAVVDKMTEHVIGFCGFKYIPEINKPDMGYRFLPDYWGKGIASETALACKQFGREQLGIKDFFADVMEENIPSLKVIQKLGLKFSGFVSEDEQTFMRFTHTTPTLLNTAQFYK